MKKPVIRIISLALLLAFVVNTTCYGLATLPASQNPQAKLEILAALQRTQIRYAESEDAIRLLNANNAECLLLSSGKYLVSKEVAQDDLKLLRGIIHEDIEAIMQIIASKDRSRYADIKGLILKYFPPDQDNRLPIDLYLNHTVARAFEWITLVNSGLIQRDRIQSQDKSFIDKIEPIINSNKHNYFTAEFWDQHERGKKIRDAINGGMRFYQAASPSLAGTTGNNAQALKDRLMRGLKYRSAMDYPFQQLYVELTQRCGVGCEFCMFGSRSITPSIENTISDEGITNVIEIVKRAKFNKLVITGEGETTLELKNALRLIENAVSPHVIMITSGNWAVGEAAAKGLMDKVNAAVASNPNIKKFEFRVSIDKYHQAKIPMERLATIVSTFTKYSDSGDYKKMELFFRSVLFEDDTVDKFAKMLGADISPLKGVHRVMRLPDGRAIKIFYKNYTIDYDSAGLDVGKYMSIEDYMKLEAGPDGIYRDAIRDGGINIAIKYDGRVNIFGGAKDTVSSIYKDSYDEIMARLSQDIIARALIDKGPMHILDICAEADPDARDRAMGYNQPAKIAEEGLNTPELRLYVSIRLIGEYVSEGKIDISGMDDDLRGLFRLDRNELKALYNEYVTDSAVYGLNAGSANRILLVGGYTSSGKGVASKLIAKRISEVSGGKKRAVIISMDDYLRGSREVTLDERRRNVLEFMRQKGLDTVSLHGGREIFDRDSPEAYCIDEMISDIAGLWKGDSIKAREYDFDNDIPSRSNKNVSLGPENTVVIIEGIHALGKDMITKLKAATGNAPVTKVFIDEPADVRFARRLIRNNDQRSNGYAETLAQWLLVAEEEKNIAKSMGLRAREGVTILRGEGADDVKSRVRAVQIVRNFIAGIIADLKHAGSADLPKPEGGVDSIIMGLDAAAEALSRDSTDASKIYTFYGMRSSAKAMLNILYSVREMLVASAPYVHTDKSFADDKAAKSIQAIIDNAPKGLEVTYSTDGTLYVRSVPAVRPCPEIEFDKWLKDYVYVYFWGLIRFTGECGDRISDYYLRDEGFTLINIEEHGSSSGENVIVTENEKTVHNNAEAVYNRPKYLECSGYLGGHNNIFFAADPDRGPTKEELDSWFERYVRYSWYGDLYFKTRCSDPAYYDDYLVSKGFSMVEDWQWPDSGGDVIQVSVYKISLDGKGAPVPGAPLPKKCLVLDCDGVLWGGVVGEDGASGIDVSDDYITFQRKVKELKDRGVILALNSKNNPRDVEAAFAAHPEMPLKLSDFTAVRINWLDKGKNIKDLADEIGIGTDSIVFIDDSPHERALVASMVQAVLVPELPADPAGYADFLGALGVFGKGSVTDEDKRRTEMYAMGSERAQFRARSMTMEEYLEGLNMEVLIKQAQEEDIPRVAQLTQRTNHFNLTTKRYTEDEIRKLLRSPEHKVFTVRYRDVFGDAGIVGTAILNDMGNNTWEIDTFCLSCRVNDLTIECAFLAQIISVLREEGVCILNGIYIPTDRNRAAANLFKDMLFQRSPGTESRWSYDLRRGRMILPKRIKILTEPGRSEVSGDKYDAESASVLVRDLLSAGLQEERSYVIKYDGSRLTDSQVEIIREYVGLLSRASKAEFKLIPCSAEMGSKDALINIYCTGKDFKGEGHVDVAITEGEMKDYLLKITGMINIALASSSIPDRLSKEDLDKYRPIMGYIRTQYKAILGEELAIPDDPDDILRTIRRIVLTLPPSARVNINSVEEYNRLAKAALSAA